MSPARPTQADAVAQFLAQVLHDDFDLFDVPLELGHVPLPAGLVVEGVCKVESERVHSPALSESLDEGLVVAVGECACRKAHRSS